MLRNHNQTEELGQQQSGQLFKANNFSVLVVVRLEERECIQLKNCLDAVLLRIGVTQTLFLSLQIG